MKTKTLQIKNFQPFIKYRKYVLLWLFTWVFYGLIMGRKSVQNKKRKSKTSNSIHQIDKKFEKNPKLTASFWNEEDGGLLLGAFTLSAVGWANFLSDLKTRSSSEFSGLCSVVAAVDVLLFVLFIFNSLTVAGSSLMVALVACSVWSREPVLPLLLAKLGGLGLGGGVDFPKECFLGDEPVEPKKRWRISWKSQLKNPSQIFIGIMQYFSNFNWHRIILLTEMGKKNTSFKSIWKKSSIKKTNVKWNELFQWVYDNIKVQGFFFLL